MGKLLFILGNLILIAVWLDAVRAAVNSLSGGFVRSFEDETKKAKAENWLKQKRNLGFTLRALSFVTTVSFASYLYIHTIESPVITFKGEWIETKNYAIFTLILLLFLILKETVGTIWLSYYRYTLLRFSLPAINILRLPLRPYEWILMHSFSKAARERQEEADEVKEVSAEDEILSLVETDNKGNLEEDEIRMIKGVFDLNDRVVREVMTPRVNVNAISIEMTIDEAKKKFVESSYSRLPVYREKIDNIVGILYAKDFLNEDKTKGKTVETIMHMANFIQESKPLDDLLEEFKKSQNHFAVVNDQFGGTAGIITIEDVLEEIVGDIRDEYDGDEEDHELIIEDDGSLTVDAKVNLEDINRLKPENQISLHDDYETIGGCIYSEISRIPVIGEIIELKQYTARILEADERSIKRLKLIPKEQEEEENSKV